MSSSETRKPFGARQRDEFDVSDSFVHTTPPLNFRDEDDEIAREHVEEHVYEEGDEDLTWLDNEKSDVEEEEPAQEFQHRLLRMSHYLQHSR